MNSILFINFNFIKEGKKEYNVEFFKIILIRNNFFFVLNYYCIVF